MGEIISQYYAWLSSLTAWLALPLGSLADSLNIPLASALLFGLIGATAPCQLSGSVATLAFLSRDVAEPRRLWLRTVAFVAGKVTVYLLVGGMIIWLGWQLDQLSPTAIPVIVFARRAMGPLLIGVGLVMLGLFRPRVSLGGQVSIWLQARVGQQQGMLPAYLLGVAFAFTFCPTLFWLFFGLTLPLALSSSGGVFLPGIFAVGTSLPVLVLAGLFASGTVNVRHFVKRFKAADVWLRHAAGIIFVLVGINETLLYWFI